MFQRYIHFLLSKAVYETDEDGCIVGSVPWYQGFYSQWTNFEEARENLKDAIEGVLTIKLLRPVSGYTFQT
jgi:predicted RNase H-like HicB family nuclease